MKPFVVLTTVLIISLSVSYLHADNLDRKVRKDVIAAAGRAKIEVDRSLINAFIEMGSHYPDGLRHVYLRVPSEKRVKRLAMYFKAKSGKCGFQKFDTPSYVGDFHWSYLSDDTVYSSFCLDSPRAAKLTKIESPFGVYHFMPWGEGIKSGTPIVLPAIANYKAANLCATFKIGAKKAIWTGNVDVDNMTIAYATTSRGCEIFINSKPKNANVFFNGRHYYRKTDTSAVRKPGLLEVKINLDGYQEWREKKKLGAGESWTINALLIKN